MRFRLTYNGPLKATQGTPGPLHTDKRAEHKHTIRREFHRQLKELWASNKFLRTHKMTPAHTTADGGIFPPRPPATIGAIWGPDPKTLRPMVDVVAGMYSTFGYRFVPLVRKEISLSCSLRVLFMRRDFPASVLSAGDIDNRLKTLIDTLRMPQVINEVPSPPVSGEDPFFVLLDDDRQITHLEVETDSALDAPQPDDRSYARIVITVELRPYDVSMFNLSFA